ncbi:MAG: hypothetical protein F6K42_25385 [Leptolyngbya sp. SIO1D8]|nr:hypothetical protein [Leptolyngbya sp. SIO1D8]
MEQDPPAYQKNTQHPLSKNQHLPRTARAPFKNLPYFKFWQLGHCLRQNPPRQTPNRSG